MAYFSKEIYEQKSEYAAKQMARELEDSNAYIAVIDTSDNDPICVAIIYQYEFDSYGNEFDETTYNVCVTYRSF